MQVGDKVIATKPFHFNNTSDIKEVHTSIKEIFVNTFTLRGYSKYLFDIKTLKNISNSGSSITVKLQ